MFELLQNLLKDHEKGVFTFDAFSLCHILYMLLIIGGIVGVFFLFRKKDQETKSKVVDRVVSIALGLYIADFFLMPFSEGAIDIGKLPFHICTLMSIMVFISRRCKKLEKFRASFTMMGLIGALMYLTYPSGVSSADGYSYRIVQTVLYHGLMIAQGVLALAFGDVKLSWKNIVYDVIAIACMSLWAVIGNVAYGTYTPEGLDSYNWFFVISDPFGVFSDKVGQFVLPFAMIVVISIMDVLIYAINFGVRKLTCKENA